MKVKNLALLMVLLILILLCAGPAQAEEEIISIYEGSEVVHDDMIGFEELSVVMDETTVTVVEGVIRRQWCRAPEGRSPLEIIKNYENAVKSIGGQIVFMTRDPQSIEIDEKKLSDYFKENRKDRGLATNVYSHTAFPDTMSEFLVGKIMTAKSEVYVVIASGKGHWAAKQNNLTFFELVTLEAELMEMGMVTMDALKEGLAAYGRVAVYNIYFDTGESKVKEESSEALGIIAGFLKENISNKYLVVGHTDNVGGYEMNLKLSKARAEAVVEFLTGRSLHDLYRVFR